MTNMKWAVAGLFGLGLIAAVCAAVLAASWQSHGEGPADGGGRAGPVSEVTVAVARHDLAAMTVIDAAAVTTRSVPQNAASMDACVDPVQVVGKVLLTPTKAGQPFSLAQFATDGSSAQLAASLQQGDRAVSIGLSDSMALEDLLYPGCMVDVLFSRAALTENGMEQQPMSITLLQGVRVLAVGDRTIVAPNGGDGLLGPTHGGRPSVSLLVDGRQAQVLKLAMQEGSVTLALRNPLDETATSVPPTGVDSLSPGLVTLRVSAPAEQPAPQVASWKPWETVIIKGGVAESVSFAHDTQGRAP